VTLQLYEPCVKIHGLSGMSSTPDNWASIKALFERAIDQEPSERSEFLAKNAPDPVVRAEVERLLLEHEEAGHFLSRPAFGDLGPDARSNSRFAAGDILAGRFRVVRFLAAGGMGEVYEAFDLELRERVAIKTILSGATLESKAITYLRREVQLARKVTHPNVCRVFDLFRNSDGDVQGRQTLFVSMELLHGRTLAHRLREKGPFELQQILPLVRQLTSALIAAHDVGVIHGDLKPGNVFLVDPKRRDDTERAVVTDFGLARPAVDVATFSLATASTLAIEGGIRGTPAYMAPEQLQGQPATVVSDVYAFGLMIYEMITGVRAFPDASIPVLIGTILTKQPPPPTSVRPDIPTSVDAVVMKALAKNPKDRYQSARELLSDFEKLAERRTWDAHAIRSLFRGKKLYATLAILLLMLLAGYIGRARYLTHVPDRSSHPLSSQPDLSYYIVAQNYENGGKREPYRVSDQQVFSSEIGIRFVFRSRRSGYLYLLNEGSTSTEASPALNVLFPSLSTNNGSSLLRPQQELTIPASGALVFDSHKGTERMWLIWSNESVADLELLKKWANPHDRGRIGDTAEARRIKELLKGSSFPSPEVSRDSTNRTNLAAAGGNLVYLINLNHI